MLQDIKQQYSKIRSLKTVHKIAVVSVQPFSAPAA